MDQRFVNFALPTGFSDRYLVKHAQRCWGGKPARIAEKEALLFGTIHNPMSNAQLQLRSDKALKAEGVNAEPKKMFGGVAFMVKGHMSVGITNKGDLMARFDPKRHEEILEWPGTKPMTFGKPGMKGFLFVDPTAVESDAALKKWIQLSLEFVQKLPPKAAKKAAAKKGSKQPAKRPADRSVSK